MAFEARSSSPARFEVAVAEREAVDRILEFLSRYAMDYLYVLVSGGKDSVAVWSLASRATRDYVVVFLHIPGQTHADNVNAVYRVAGLLGVREARVVRVDATRRIRERLGEAISTCSLPCLLHVVVYTHRGEDFWAALLRYGYPAPFSRFGWGVRWCCGTFKHRVFNRLPFNGVREGREWKFGVDGVKATDSPRRRRIFTSYEKTWEKTRDTYLFPILEWSDEDVWAYLRYAGLYEAVRAQYERWGRSPNCMFCPMVGRREQIEKTLRAMPAAARRRLREALEELLPRYKPGTYSHTSITKWLSVLEEVERALSPRG